MIGFATLIVAHNLAMSGDTLEMMQAVLDNNFWLATHVIVITIGYSAMFVAGALGIIFILMGLFKKDFDRHQARRIGGMTYGIVCFAALFSLVGTILGGIWADQSWGRFWGWDPKENGALLIVLWTAVILHARWGGIARERDIAAMAVVGNIVTSWSWFGTNMLGVGLHSYGFMDEAFWALTGFVLSQVFIIIAAYLPWTSWMSAFGRSQVGLPPLPSRRERGRCSNTVVDGGALEPSGQ
jgi:ABC-type transport system involved in cytochrome c biogenesis permease subunit